jgi:hypothetical protein
MKIFEVLLLNSNKTLRDYGMYIETVSGRNNIFETNGQIDITFNYTGLLLGKFEPVKIYYTELNQDGSINFNDNDVKMNGYVLSFKLNPLKDKTITISFVDVTHFLTIQQMEIKESYTYNSFNLHILNVLKDNIGSLIKIGLYDGIQIGKLKFAILLPSRKNIKMQNEDDDSSERKPKISMYVYDYIEKLANQNSVHITTLTFNGITYLYFLDTGYYVNNVFLANQIPSINQEDTIDFNYECDYSKMYDEISLYSNSSLDDSESSSSFATHKIDVNKLWYKNDNDSIQKITNSLKNALNVEYKNFQKKESIVQHETLKEIGRYICETNISQGLSIICELNSNNNFIDKDRKNIKYLIGAYINITDILFASKLIDNKRNNLNTFIISGITFNFNKQQGYIQSIFICPSFILQ